MKKHFFLLMGMVGFVAFAQEPTNLQTYNDPIVDAAINSQYLYTIEQPNNSSVDGYLKKRDYQGNEIATANFPNDNPSFALVQPFEIVVDEQNIYSVAQTFGAIVAGDVKVSESLFDIPNDLDIVGSNRLVAYQSEFQSISSTDSHVYVLYSAFYSDAALGTSVNGDGTSFISNPGNNVSRLWLLQINKNDISDIQAVFEIHPTSGVDIRAKKYDVDDRLKLREKMINLSNNYKAFGYSVGVGSSQEEYLAVFNPENLDSNNDGVLDPIHTFGPYTGGANKLSLIYCGDRYVLANYAEKYLETYADDFNLISRSYIFDYEMGGNPAELACLSSGDIKVFIGMGSSPMAETPRSIIIDENLVQKFARGGFGGTQPFPNVGGVTESWVQYYKSFVLNDTEVLHIANYEGIGVSSIGDGSLPASSNPYGVFFKTNQTAPDTSLTLNTTPAVWQEVFMNVRLDPNNPMQLVPCNEDPNCGESWVRIAPGTTLQADEAFVNDFVSGINMPPGSGYQVEMANMGTDLTKPMGYQRFVMLKIKPIGIPRQSQTLDNFLSMKVYLTENTQTLGLDTFDDSTFGLYPNPVNDVLNIKSQKTIEKIQVYSLTGQKVLESKMISGSLDNVNLAHLNSGMYVVHIYSDDGAQIVKKVVKR